MRLQGLGEAVAGVRRKATWEASREAVGASAGT